MIPLIFVRISVYRAKEDKFLSTDVNNPAKRIIIPCPTENKKSINAAYTMFALIEATAIIPARIGVEQGVEAKANINPSKKG